MPTKHVEIVGTKRTFGVSAKNQFMELYSKRVDHNHLGGYDFISVALAGTGHSIVKLRQQQDVRRYVRKMRCSFFWKQAVLHVPCRNY